MWDAVLDHGTVFDWISPLLAFVQDLMYGPSAAFLVPEDGGWSGREIERLLRQHGIRTWGLMTVNGTIMLNVRQAQARWADYVLCRAGVPIAGGAPGNAAQPRRSGRRRADASSLQVIGHEIDRLLDEFGL